MVQALSNKNKDLTACLKNIRKENKTLRISRNSIIIKRKTDRYRAEQKLRNALNKNGKKITNDVTDQIKTKLGKLSTLNS